MSLRCLYADLVVGGHTDSKRGRGFAVSDDVLSIIPTDQNYVPSVEAQQTAVALLREMLPDGEMCKAEVYDQLHFIDQGANCEAVVCSSCGAHLGIDTESDAGVTWWYEMGDAISASEAITDLRTTMPCCGASVLFTSLQFDWPAGFAHFRLSIWNPNIEGGALNADKLGRLEAILGCKLTQIRAHY
jgi:hypothetical protein